MLETPRRVIAILLSLSVGWSTLEGAFACVGENSGNASAAVEKVMEGPTAMKEMQGMAPTGTVDAGGRSDSEQHGRHAECCASAGSPEAAGETVDECVLMLVCQSAVLPASVARPVVASRIPMVRISDEEVDPPAYAAPPDAPPPRG
jgi:hypothetical protein